MLFSKRPANYAKCVRAMGPFLPSCQQGPNSYFSKFKKVGNVQNLAAEVA